MDGDEQCVQSISLKGVVMTVQFRRPLPSDFASGMQPAAAAAAFEPRGVEVRFGATGRSRPADIWPALLAEAPRRRSFTLRGVRWFIKIAYLCVRPVLRPVAWRTRGFMLNDVLPQLEQLRASQTELGRNLASVANRQALSLEAAHVVAPPPLVRLEASVRVAAGGAPLRRKVHQFHAGSATGDAITNALLLIRDRLRADGYESEIYVEHLGVGLEHELLPLDALPMQDDHVLLVHHSMGHARFADVAASPAPKVLVYHNITPPELLTHDVGLQQASKLGRAQLRQWRDLVVAAVADSAYNGLELRKLGFASVTEATLLFDIDALLRRGAAKPDDGEANDAANRPFTVLFVGRMVASKGQAELVDAFAAFAAAFVREHASLPRLILAGSHGGAGDPALVEVLARIALHGLQAQIVVTGKVSDDALFAWYRAADLYVSLSRHEGFGVPLVEAIAHGVPVLALAAAAVPYTVGSAATLVHDTEPCLVASAMLDLARDRSRPQPSARAEALAPWRWERHWPVLGQALTQAGAAPPPSRVTRLLVEAGQHFVVTGHVNGSYSLAVVNRLMALSLEQRQPGTVRLLPVEGQPALLDDVPMTQRRALACLAGRAPSATGPVVAISQHYPLLVPDVAADASLALLFWEETLLPDDVVASLNSNFDGVLAPCASVARALADSGVRVPIRQVGFAPELQRYEAVGAARARQGRQGAAGGTNFLHVSSCFARKGVDLLLTAWAAAFRDTDKVRLVIKGFPNQHNDVTNRIAALRKADPGMAEVVFINRDLTPDALVALYEDADVMVLPSRGEGFNIPAAEALSAGLKLIVTGFGGHMDFCTDPTVAARVRLLDYRLVRARSHVASRHALWAEPDGDDLTRALLEAAGQRRPQAVLPARPVGAPVSTATEWAARISSASASILLESQRSPKRVAWVSPWQVACGVAEYSSHLLAALPAETRPLVLCDERPARDDDIGGPRLRSRAAFRVGDSSSAPQLANAIAVADPDVLVIQHQPGLLPWQGLADLLETSVLRRRCVVITLHNTRSLLTVEPELRTRVAGCLAATRRVLVHAIDDLAVLQDLGVTNAAWLPHGTTPGPAPHPTRAIGDAPVIGTTGFFLAHKGISNLIEAAALLRVDWPGLRLRLVCARYPDPISDREIERCQALARTLDIEDAIEWHWAFLPNDRRLDLLSGCDLVVMPYEPTQESASGAVRQAIASGAATLVSNLPIFEDLGDAVERLRSTSPAVMATHIQALLQAPRRRSMLQSRGQMWLADHDWSRIAGRLDGMLEAYHQEHLREALAPAVTAARH